MSIFQQQTNDAMTIKIYIDIKELGQNTWIFRASYSLILIERPIFGKWRLFVYFLITWKIKIIYCYSSFAMNSKDFVVICSAQLMLVRGSIHAYTRKLLLCSPTVAISSLQRPYKDLKRVRLSLFFVTVRPYTLPTENCSVLSLRTGIEITTTFPLVPDQSFDIQLL